MVPAMVQGRRVQRNATRFVPTVLLVVVVLSLSGCLSGVEKAGQELTGYEEWRPADPTQEEYFVGVEDGFQSPHPFRWEGDMEQIDTWGVQVHANSDGLRLVPIAGATEDANHSASDVELRGVSGRLETPGGVVELDDDTVRLVLRSEAEVTGRMRLSSTSNVHIEDDTVTFAPAGPLFMAQPVNGGAPATDAANASMGGVHVVARSALVFPTMTVHLEQEEEVRSLDNATLHVDANDHVRAAAYQLVVSADDVAMESPVQPTDAPQGLRSAGPIGHVTVTAAGSTLELRSAAHTLDGGTVFVRSIDGLSYDAGGQSVLEGSLVQLLTGKRPWIEAEIGFDHPARDADRDAVQLRVPPGEEFRTMISARETSGVGSAMSILPTKGRDDTGITVRFGEYWEDERVFDETAGRTFADAVRSIFVIGDSTVSLGPRETAYLPVFLDVPANLTEEAEVEIRLHPQNANVESILLVLAPDADAPRSDVERRTEPAPGLVVSLLVITGLLAAARRRWL